MIKRHGAEILATARRYSLSSQDAEDAYQRALEVLIRRAPSIADDELLPWMKKVVRHEAFAIYHGRKRVTLPGDDEVELEGGRAPEPYEQVERYERLRQGAEAIRRLKPQEVRALALRAEGLTYRQIAEVTGWTRTKVNRCLTEGRQSFLKRVARIESGAECKRLEPLLSALADGEATPQQQRELLPHLHSCLSCRAALRAFRELPHRAAEVVPVAAAGGEDVPGALWRFGESVVWWFQERAALAGMKVQAATEGASTGKVAAVAASTAALAGGTLAVGVLDGGDGRPLEPERREPLVERMMPPVLPPDLSVAEEPLASVAPPPPPMPTATPPSPPSVPAPTTPSPLPSSPPPEPTAPVRPPPEVPYRVTIPVENGRDSVLPGVDPSERTIDPMTTPLERGGAGRSSPQQHATEADTVPAEEGQ